MKIISEVNNRELLAFSSMKFPMFLAEVCPFVEYVLCTVCLFENILRDDFLSFIPVVDLTESLSSVNQGPIPGNNFATFHFAVYGHVY
jgi:hypothetical protein